METERDINCHLCPNCRWRDRWEAHYQKFLKDNPTQTEFIDEMRKTDTKYLPCQRQEQPELNQDDYMIDQEPYSEEGEDGNE